MSSLQFCEDCIITLSFRKLELGGSVEDPHDGGRAETPATLPHAPSPPPVLCKGSKRLFLPHDTSAGPISGYSQEEWRDIEWMEEGGTDGQLGRWGLGSAA